MVGDKAKKTMIVTQKHHSIRGRDSSVDAPSNRPATLAMTTSTIAFVAGSSSGSRSIPRKWAQGQGREWSKLKKPLCGSKDSRLMR
jgi:hypothetical protein